MNSSAFMSRVAGAAATGALAFACSQQPLKPAAVAEAGPENTAEVTVAGVRVVAAGDAWTGEADVRGYVTPVHVSIQNGGEQPVSVRYSNLALVSTYDKGDPAQGLPALAPDQAQSWDPALRSQNLQQGALREALVRPGDALSGYVYFQRIPKDMERVTLSVDLIDAGSGRSMGTALIPFVVDR